MAGKANLFALLQNAPCGDESLAQNRGFCAKEEPQAQKANKAGITCLVAKCALRRRGGRRWIRTTEV